MDGYAVGFASGGFDSDESFEEAGLILFAPWGGGRNRDVDQFGNCRRGRDWCRVCKVSVAGFLRSILRSCGCCGYRGDGRHCSRRLTAASGALD